MRLAKYLGSSPLDICGGGQCVMLLNEWFASVLVRTGFGVFRIRVKLVWKRVRVA